MLPSSISSEIPYGRAKSLFLWRCILPPFKIFTVQPVPVELGKMVTASTEDVVTDNGP